MPALPLRELIVATKSHADIGFTEPEAKVLHDACRWLLPLAAVQARRMRENGDGFCWVVPAYLAELALEWLDGEDLRRVETGFACGDIAWHALPFTTHTELLDEGLLDALMSVSRRLDARFGKQTTCAKLTDVPGHPLALVRALARAGIQCLHIGVNWMSPAPEIPALSRWRDGAGNEVVLAINPQGYGGEIRIPGEDCAFVWDMVGDNMEVPSEHDIRASLAALRTANPGAMVRGGRPEDWAGPDLLSRAKKLPEMEIDLGDSWIFGTGSDPWKMQRFRELVRLRKEWLAAHRLLPASPVLVRFDRELLLVAEHTWGGAVAAWTMHDRTHWNNVDFARIRERGCWKALSASWQEQRDHVTKAIAALADAKLRGEAQAACDACAPEAFDRTGWQAVAASAEHDFNGVRLQLDARGAVVSLHDGMERTEGAIGLLRYQTFDAADCRRAVEEYCTGRENSLLEEFTKMGLAGTEAVSRWWEPRMVGGWRRDDSLVLELAFDETAVIHAGAPRRVVLHYQVRPGSLECRVDWFEKHPTRLPEALWWTFQPAVADPRAWRVDKAGLWIDPCTVPRKGGLWLHGVQRGARNGAVELQTRDAHLLAVGEPLLYRFPDRDVNPSGGLHLNLVNNCWGTNFPQWCGDDLGFRATLVW